MIRSIITFTFISFLLIGCETKSPEVAPVTVFENDYAKVSHVTLEAGETQPVHFGEDRIIYTLSDYTIEFQRDEMEAEENQYKENEVHFHPAGEHSSKNVGSETAEWLVFERKTDDLPLTEGMEEDIEELLNMNEETSVLFENDLFKVTKVQVEPGWKFPQHEGSNRIVYSLSNYTVEYESDAEENETREFEIGDVHWHQAAEHSLTNAGDTRADFLIVVYKNG